jgi:hypothetical protein
MPRKPRPKEDLTQGCFVMELPEDKQPEAALSAIDVNPVNRPMFEGLMALAPRAVTDIDPPAFLSALTSKYWGSNGVRLTVSFLDDPKRDLIDKIISYMNLWGKYGNVKFEWTQTGGRVRIARDDGGYWSYLGKDIDHVAAGQPTMNLEGFTAKTPDSEFMRVVVHETGHTLGFPHEHMRGALIERIDRQKALDYFKRYSGWGERTTVQNVLTPLEERALLATPEADETSIMCYRLPGSITKDGKPIPGGDTISNSDKLFIAKIYPLEVKPPEGPEFVVKFDPAAKTVTLPTGWKVG